MTYLNTPVVTPTRNLKTTENGDLLLHLPPDEPILQVEGDSSETSSVKSVEAIFHIDELTSQVNNSTPRNNENHTQELVDISESLPIGKYKKFTFKKILYFNSNSKISCIVLKIIKFSSKF